MLVSQTGVKRTPPNERVCPKWTAISLLPTFYWRSLTNRSHLMVDFQWIVWQHMLPRWDICLSPIFSTSPMICPFTLLVIERQRLADSIQSGCQLSCIQQVQRVWVAQFVLPLIGTQLWVTNVLDTCVELTKRWKRLGRWMRANLVKNHLPRFMVIHFAGMQATNSSVNERRRENWMIRSGPIDSVMLLPFILQNRRVKLTQNSY